MIRPAEVWSTLVTATSDALADPALALIDDHHRAVIEVRDALPRLLALAEHLDAHGFARHDRRLQRVREIVDVEHRDAAQLGALVQGCSGRDHLGAAGASRARAASRRPSATPGTSVASTSTIAPGRPLQALDNVEPELAACALARVGGVRDLLQLAQHRTGGRRAARR
jgi:hypothetical protein